MSTSFCQTKPTMKSLVLSVLLVLICSAYPASAMRIPVGGGGGGGAPHHHMRAVVGGSGGGAGARHHHIRVGGDRSHIKQSHRVSVHHHPINHMRLVAVAMPTTIT